MLDNKIIYIHIKIINKFYEQLIINEKNVRFLFYEYFYNSFQL